MEAKESVSVKAASGAAWRAISLPLSAVRRPKRSAATSASLGPRVKGTVRRNPGESSSSSLAWGIGVDGERMQAVGEFGCKKPIHKAVARDPA